MTSRLGFTQLAVELIALSPIEEQNVLYGAVTMGDVWRFGFLDRSIQQITQDINLFKVPDEIDTLVRVLMGIVQGAVIAPDSNSSFTVKLTFYQGRCDIDFSKRCWDSTSY